MEKTSQNKAKFFAQYFGQEVFRQTHNNEQSGCLFDVSPLSLMGYIELKPLSVISDDDAITVSELFGHKVYVGTRFIQNIINGNCINQPLHIATQAIDFLRSNGYALPYLGLSVEQQIEYGWIKLTI